MHELANLHKRLPKGIGVLVGAIVPNSSKLGKAFLNAAVFLQKGKPMRVFAKQLLPTYDVFDEGRHIEPGDATKNILNFGGKKILVTICEDIWAWPSKENPGFSRYGANPLLKVKKQGLDLVVNLSASPFTHSKFINRRRVVKATASHFKKPMVYVNMVGGQDELIFDGGSFAVDAKGEILAQCVRFAEDLNVFDLKSLEGGTRELPSGEMEIIRRALVLGIKDFASKTGFTKVHLGLSGGIDSALVAALAVDAFGPMNVSAIFMPSRFTSKESEIWAKKLADNLGIKLLTVPIADAYERTVKELDQDFGPKEFGVWNENIQARLRGMILMSYANREGSLLLGTTNKSEMAVGYGTLYGDMIGGLLPIGDMLKTEVFELARHYNSESEVIPKEIIARPPSAELRENQTDQDSLPPYEELDRTIKKLVMGFHSAKTPLEKRVLGMMMKSEFKRWQSPPILKISDHAFGRGRRFPVANRAAE
jgi:NAD+ synthase (glutamine-hydrolysing)